MLYEARPSAFGIGLFAAQDIPKGTLLWKIRALPYADAVKAGGKPAEAAAASGCNVLSYSCVEEARARLEELGADGGRELQV